MIPKEIEELLKDMTIPQVKVATPDGKPTSIDDYDSFMQFLMLASIASKAIKIQKYYQDRESQGWIENFAIAVTSVPPSQEVRLTRPAQSISVVNDGPGIVWLEWNVRFTTITILNPTEKCDINFETHKLERFFAQCPLGVVSNIRAVAKG